MPLFKLPVSWTMIADMVVEAATLEDAAIKAAENMPLPKGEYCDSSFEVNTELISDCPSVYGEQK